MANSLNDGCNTSYALSAGINEIFIPLDSVNASLQVGDGILVSRASETKILVQQ